MVARAIELDHFAVGLLLDIVAAADRLLHEGYRIGKDHCREHNPCRLPWWLESCRIDQMGPL